jgi:hypothetical protein
MIQWKFFNPVCGSVYPPLRKYFTVVQADLTQACASDVEKWLLIAPLIGIATGLVIGGIAEKRRNREKAM